MRAFHVGEAVIQIVLDEREAFEGFTGPCSLSVPVDPGNSIYVALVESGAEVAPYQLPPIDLVAYAARRRWEIIETGSISLGGVEVPTAADTRNIVTAAYVQAKADPAFVVDPWKVGAGQYVTLDAATVIAIGDALTAYVQSMFALNRAIDEAIIAGTITTTAEVDAALTA